MAFNSKDFSVMAYANGFTLWNYVSEDTLTSIKGTGYFNNTSPFVRKGDMILIVANNAGTIESGIFSVGSVVNGVVSVNNITAAVTSTPAAG